MEPFRAFVIDDDKHITEAIKHAFHESDAPFLVTTFTDPEEGLRTALAYPPDLIVLDLQMPSISGEKILKQLKKEKVPTRVVVLTEVEDIAKIVEIIKDGACNYITKPFSSDELIKVAARAVILEDTLDKAGHHKT